MNPRKKNLFDRANILNIGPSRLYEKAPLTPSDSLDELASQIPRCLLMFHFKSSNQLIFMFIIGKVISYHFIAWNL